MANCCKSLEIKCKILDGKRKYAWKLYFQLKNEIYDQLLTKIREYESIIANINNLSAQHDFVVPNHFKEELTQHLRDLNCPVCMDIMTRETFDLTPCFHKCCNNCINMIKQTTKKCPICRHILE